jgi:hypothetical protein
MEQALMSQGDSRTLGISYTLMRQLTIAWALVTVWSLMTVTVTVEKLDSWVIAFSAGLSAGSSAVACYTAARAARSLRALINTWDRTGRNT